MKERIEKMFLESAAVKTKSAQILSTDVAAVVKMIVTALQAGKKIMIFGNGGSAADAQHFTGELVSKFKIERRPLPAMAPHTDTSVLTAIANDDGYHEVFRKWITAFGNPGDIAIAITTSDVELKPHGHSANIAYALREARNKKMKTIGLFSEKSFAVVKMVDLALLVPAQDTPRIQECHETILHIICELAEEQLK
jgi:D-sedoheptulose 7-phosphate isomerase